MVIQKFYFYVRAFIIIIVSLLVEKEGRMDE